MINWKFLLFIFSLFLPLSYVSAGTILSPHIYAWSNNIGYISFANVTVSNSALGGYAWATNKGFIKFDPAQGGVLNNGAGNLSGSAWGEQLGYIDFDNVSISPSTGKFSGTATGDLVGTITFDCPNYCDVQTDWRPPVNNSVVGSSAGATGGGSGGLTNNQLPVTKPPIITITPPLTQNLAPNPAPILRSARAYDIIIFNEVMTNWGKQEQGNSGDINKDGVVDVFDFNLLMVRWGNNY